jgi:hypothetical protein
MQVVRNYVKRETAKSDWSGDIGRVVLETDASVIKLNGKPVPLQSMEYLLTFALQAFQDAYAGAQSAEEAKSFFEKKLAACIDGTIGVRGAGGGSVSEETRVIRQVVREILRKRLEKEAYEAKYKDDDEAVDAAFVKNEEKLRPFVDARLEELKKERERKAKLAAKAADLDL